MVVASTWLELLLEDAPVEVLEQHRRNVPDSEEEATRALLLHARLRDRAQRASGLAALSDIASRLASARDLPQLLNDISAQARQLLRTDVAYLALVEGEALRIRYFDGLLSPIAREIRLSMTAGLAGRIMTSGHAAWTDDYLSDASIEHLPQADSFAGDEGLRSILGVPLAAAGTALGVLFAAERARRPFSDSERALLSGLAGHAALAIENTRLLEAERAAAAELRDANERLRATAAAVDRAVVLHDRLTDAVVRGGGPADVVRAVSEVLKGPVQLVDELDRPLAGPDLGVAAAHALIAAGERRAIVLPAEGGGQLVVCPVVAADAHLGCLVLRSEEPTELADLRLLERGAVVIALALVQQRAVAEAAVRSRGELLGALVEGGEVDVLEHRAAAARVDLSRAHRIAVVEVDDATGTGVAAELARRHDGLVVERGGRLVLLVPVEASLQPLVGVATLGVSGPVRGAAAVPEAHAEAKRCLAAALALGRRHLVASADSLGVYRFLLASDARDDSAAFVRHTLGPLLDHDEAKGSDLTRTVEAYLSSGRQHTATAEALHIHPNTLYQRLTRITAILGEDWRTPDRALDVHVAVRLHRLAQQLASPEVG